MSARTSPYPVMSTFRSLALWTWPLLMLALAGSLRGDSLDNWTPVASGVSSTLRGAACGNGQFIAVGEGAVALRSTNALDWTTSTLPGVFSLNGVAFGECRFVAVGGNGVILATTNGSVWTALPSGTTAALDAVAYTSLGWVVGGANGTLLTSGDGTTWVKRTVATTTRFAGVGGGLDRAFAGTAGNRPSLFQTSSGSSWSSLAGASTATPPELFNGPIVFGDGVLVGVAIRGEFYRSLDATNWTQVTSPFPYCFGLAFARHTFVTVGGNFSSGGRVIGTSADGATWTPRYSQPAEGRLLAVAYGRHRFVAVGDEGAILVSDPMLWMGRPVVSGKNLVVSFYGDATETYHLQRSSLLTAPQWEEVAVYSRVGEPATLTLPLGSETTSYFFRVLGD